MVEEGLELDLEGTQCNLFKYSLKNREKVSELFRYKIYWWKQDEVVRRGGCLVICYFSAANSVTCATA